MSLVDIAAYTLEKALLTGKVESAEAWYKYVYRSRQHMTLITKENRLLGFAVAYHSGENLFVEWVITFYEGVLSEFLDLVKRKYPGAKKLVFDRGNKSYKINLSKVISIQKGTSSYGK
jgi:hypothetical protein